MNNGVLFLDLKKAFDTVDYNLLLTKLEYIRARGQTLEWYEFISLSMDPRLSSSMVCFPSMSK